jgi:eukaryotic-like serine/threonine-protein kinase
VKEAKSTSPSRVLRFGVFQANLAARELRKHGVRVRLPGQPFCILLMLLEKPGEIVTREEMRQRLWASDTFVDFEHSLNSAIKKLRTALGDSPENSRYIETVPRFGYRFIAPLEEVSTTPTGGDSSRTIGGSTGESSVLELTQPASSRTRSVSLRLVLLAAALGLPAVFLVEHFFPRSAALPLKERDVVVLADFENTTGDQVFNEALRQGLAVSLEQSSYIQLLSDRKSAVILKQMGHPPDERLTGQLAIDLCQRAGSKVMVQGSISSLGTIYIIGLTALRCENSDAVAHEQAEAKRKEDIIRALGEAATRLRKRLGESMQSIREYSTPLEQVTTTSLEALKAYATGTAAFDREGGQPALPFFMKAVELDPAFAMAYGQLASIYQNLGETQLARDNAIKAFEHKERLTGSERLVIESWYNVFVTGDLEKATQLYEMEIQSHTPTASVLNDMAATYGTLGRYEKAVEILRQSLTLDPDSAITYGNLAVTLMDSNRFDEARAVLAEADHRKLQMDYLLQVRYWNAFLEGNTEEMGQIISQGAGVPGARQLLLSEQARTEAYFGRFEKSRQYAESAAKLMADNGDKESAAACLGELAVREAEIGDITQARKHTGRSLQLARSQSVVTLAALVMVQSGDLKRAQALGEELSKKYPSDTLVQKYWLPTIRARAELRQGNPSKALEILSVAAPFDFATPLTLTVGTLYPVYVRGDAYLAAGDGRRAAAEYSKLIDRPGLVLNYPLGALAHLGRARAYALTGDSAKASSSYQEFWELWKGADPSLPVLRQARAEFSKLI